MYLLIALVGWPILSFIGAWLLNRFEDDVDVADLVFITSVSAAAALIWPVLVPFAIIVMILSVLFT